VFATIPVYFHALYQLLVESLSFVSVGFGAPLLDLNTQRLQWKLRVNRIPRSRWCEIDNALSVMFSEYRHWADKTVAFDEDDRSVLMGPNGCHE